MSPVPASAGRTRKSLRVRAAARLTSRTTLATLVAALVLGIIGMHALASNDEPAAPAAVSSSMTGMNSADRAAAMASGASHDRHDLTGPAADSTRSAAETSTRRGSTGHDMTSMVVLCVVMLAAAALTLLVLLIAGILRLLLPAAFEPAALRARTVAWVRGTGPPHEWQFSVIRC